MYILIKNCSSPGASFTSNTDSVILACYQWTVEHAGEHKPFIEFRIEASKAKGFNDNNARNIYPLLQNFGFVKYSKGDVLNYDKFFTNTGKAYAKIVETEELINKSNYTDVKKKQSLIELKKAKHSLVYDGLVLLFSKETNYNYEMKAFLNFTFKFGKINKTEFAYLLYSLENQIDDEQVADVINQYRNNGLVIDVEVSVRNDIDLKKQMGTQKRKEGLSFLTAYNYFISLYEQAGLITKYDRSYYKIVDDEVDKIKSLLED